MLVSILLVVSGIVAAQMVTSRKATHDQLLGTTEPLANAAQDLYSALSVADAAAVTGFISGGIEPEVVRDRYEQAIGGKRPRNWSPRPGGAPLRTPTAPGCCPVSPVS